MFVAPCLQPRGSNASQIGVPPKRTLSKLLLIRVGAIRRIVIIIIRVANILIVGWRVVIWVGGSGAEGSPGGDAGRDGTVAIIRRIRATINIGGTHGDVAPRATDRNIAPRARSEAAAARPPHGSSASRPTRHAAATRPDNSTAATRTADSTTATRTPNGANTAAASIDAATTSPESATAAAAKRRRVRRY
jgi:hypothetical protein